MGEEGVDLGRTHGVWMPQAMEAHEAHHPVHICHLGARAVVPRAQHPAQPIEQLESVRRRPRPLRLVPIHALTSSPCRAVTLSKDRAAVALDRPGQRRSSAADADNGPGDVLRDTALDRQRGSRIRAASGSGAPGGGSRPRRLGTRDPHRRRLATRAGGGAASARAGSGSLTATGRGGEKSR